jgi:hypothetical protein
MAKKMNRVIFINRILEPILFANQLIEFLFDRNYKIEITLYGKIEPEDKKALMENCKSSLVSKIFFSSYNLELDIDEFRKIKCRLEKYFVKDWGLIVNENQKGFFSFQMNIFNIDCVDERDKEEKKRFLDSLIKDKIVDKYEIIEDDYKDPYYKGKKSQSI